MAAATLRAVGGSVMVAIPKPLLEDLGLKADSKVKLTVENGRLVVESAAKPLRYELADLVAQIKGPPPPLEFKEDAPRGSEVW